MSSSGNLVSLRYYKGVRKLDVALDLIDRYSNGSESEAVADLCRTDLAKVIVEFCATSSCIKNDLGVTREQLSSFAEGGEIPKSVVKKFRDLLSSSREHAIACLQREAV